MSRLIEVEQTTINVPGITKCYCYSRHINSSLLYLWVCWTSNDVAHVSSPVHESFIVFMHFTLPVAGNNVSLANIASYFKLGGV